MTTNIERATEVVRDGLAQARNAGPIFDTRKFPDAAVQALADAGLLMPDLPKPDSKGGWRTEVIGAGKGFFAVRTPGVVDFVSSAGVYGNTSEMIRREALRMLAAARHAEQWQGNE